MEILIECGDFAESAVENVDDGFCVQETQLRPCSRDA